MTGIGNKEAELIAEIERLKQTVRDVRRRIEHARTEADKRALNHQIAESLIHIDHLKRLLPR